jgi:dipeptidyl aminopeptidase/acylaminoacyl peptidase
MPITAAPAFAGTSHIPSLAEAVRTAAEAVQASSAAAAAAATSSSPTNSTIPQHQGHNQESLEAPQQQHQQQQRSFGVEQLVLHENQLSAGHSYWDVYEKEVSPDGSRIAFTYDTVGDECYSLQVSIVPVGCSGVWEFWHAVGLVHILLEVSPDGSRIAFTYETVGNERCSLQVGCCACYVMMKRFSNYTFYCYHCAASGRCNCGVQHRPPAPL